MRRVVTLIALLVAASTSGVACSRAFNTMVQLTGGPTTTETTATRGSTAQEHLIAADLVARVNDERAARGLRPLAWDATLAQRASDWSDVMSRTGLHHSDLHPLLAGFVGVAENIGTAPARTRAGTLHVAWMRSDSHRHDLLAPNVDRIGIGVVCTADGTMWATQEFASTQSGDFGPLPPAEPLVRPDPGSVTC